MTQQTILQQLGELRFRLLKVEEERRIATYKNDEMTVHTFDIQIRCLLSRINFLSLV